MNRIFALLFPNYFSRIHRQIIPLLVAASLLLILSPSYARQAGISITAKVTGSEDQQPVPHANVTIDRKGIATATNAGGRFLLLIPAVNLADTLKISCIGFKTKYLPIAGMQDKQELSIVLEKNITELKAVKVAYYDAPKIIQTAISRIPQNYINHPHILRGFYRMYTYSKTDPLQLSEAVFDVYNFGYSDKHADQFKLIKARNEKNNRDFGMIELGQKPNSVFEDDVMNHLPASGFLSEKGMQKHVFKVIDVVDVQGYQAYEIDFEEKPGETEGTFRGEMFIDTKTYAFISFSFGLSPSALDDLGSANFISRALLTVGNADVALKDDHTAVSYQEVGHKWVLSHVEGDHVLSVKDSASHSDFLAHIKFNYQVTAVDTLAKNAFTSKIGRNENINDHPSDNDPKFWKDYNILLADEDADTIFEKIADINKAGKIKEK